MARPTHDSRLPLGALLLVRARAHRKAPTASEAILWEHLRRRGIAGARFRRQVPVGPYIVDFAALSHKLIVEIDGARHDVERDRERDAFLARLGFRVVRVKAFMVERHISVVLHVIACAMGG